MTERCSCETEARGPHGPVNDNEILYRAVLSPQHFLADGRGLKPSLFSFADIKRKGVSLIRLEKIARQDLCIFCDALAAMKEEREWKGGLEFAASVVRALTDKGGRLMCLLDDPTEATDQLPRNDAHALAIASHSEVTDEDAKEIRNELLEVGIFSACA